MPLPLPKTLYDVGPGGGIVTSMGGGNALANANYLRKYNQAKAEYAPETLLAQAASQAAYANNIAPQYMAKMLQDMGIKGNLSDAQLSTILQRVYSSGTNGNPLINTLNQRLMQRYQNMGQQNKNPISWMMEKLKDIIHPGQQQTQNPMVNPGQGMSPQQSGNVFNQSQPMPQQANQPVPMQGGMVDENGNPASFGGDTPTPVTPEQSQSLEALNQGGSPANKPIEMTLDTGQRQHPVAPSYGENEAFYRGKQAQGEVLGKAKGDMQKSMGEQQEALGNSGVVLDRLIDEFTNPEFVNLRNEFPYLQDTQIEAASHLNNPKIQHLIGTIKADIESFKGSTVMGFGGQTLKREFDYADQLKPSTKDTVYTASGKLETLKALHDIASKKVSLINQFLKDKRMTPEEAISKANKMIDIKAIDKRVKELTAPSIKLENPITKATMWITLPRARELGFTDDHVKRLGMKNG